VSGSASGSIIGKGGATISEIEVQSGSRVQLSKPKETFPGTSERILLLTGTINCILTALHLLITKIVQEEVEQGSKSDASPIVIKLVAPNATCGAILGKQGSTMKAFTDDSGAEIKLSSKEAMIPGVTDRVVTITGTMEQTLRATALVSNRIVEEAAYPTSIARPYTYTATPQFGLLPASARAPPLQMPPPALRSGPPTTVVVAVPDEHVGAIIGRSGATISEMQQVAGVSIKVSGKEDVVAETRHRKITVSGPSDGVAIAQYLIQQKGSIGQSLFFFQALAHAFFSFFSRSGAVGAGGGEARGRAG